MSFASTCISASKTEMHLHFTALIAACQGLFKLKQRIYCALLPPSTMRGRT